MVFVIHANHKSYLVGDHALKGMRQDGITEEMIIEALEQGDMIEQAHGSWKYERQVETGDHFVIVVVITTEEDNFIKTVYDDSREKGE
jgi:Domain of unknown function (DUF4258)